MNELHFSEKNQTDTSVENGTASLSRRQWLGRVSLPALATVGAGLIGANAFGSPKKDKAEDKLSGARIYNVKDFGAKGDGKTLDTMAIQSAIDKCFKDKGGIVLFPSGDFLSGTIELKSNVTIHLSANGKLLGSPKRSDYTAGKGVPSGNGNIVFLYAVNAENITLEGTGTIDGNGLAFYNGKGDNTGPGQRGIGGNFDRPHLIIFSQCKNFFVRDVFLTASAYHCFRILKCRNVHINGVRIYNRVNKNNDGFHFNDSEYVHITNCDVQCQDDACALFGSNKFVTVTNCTFSTRWSIFRFGGGESQNIAISNCLIYDTYGCPIKISAGRAGIENLTFSNIIMKNVTGPIGIGFSGPSQNNTNSNPQPQTKSFIRNIAFNGIRATVVAQPLEHPDIHFELYKKEGEKNSCITLNAMGEYYLENISFTDVHVKYAGGGTAEQAAKKVPEIAAEYFGVWDEAPGGPPAYGMYVRNVKGLTLQNVRLEYNQPEARPAIIFDNVQDASMNQVCLQGSTADCVFRLIDAKDILITAAKLLTPASAFLRAEGKSTDGIIVDGGDLLKAAQPVSLEKGVSDKSVRIRL